MHLSSNTKKQMKGGKEKRRRKRKIKRKRRRRTTTTTKEGGGGEEEEQHQQQQHIPLSSQTWPRLLVESRMHPSECRLISVLRPSSITCENPFLFSWWKGFLTKKCKRDSSVVRAPDSWLKGRGFESLQECRESFLLRGQLSVLTLISVSVPPPCYRSST